MSRQRPNEINTSGFNNMSMNQPQNVNNDSFLISSNSKINRSIVNFRDENLGLNKPTFGVSSYLNNVHPVMTNPNTTDNTKFNYPNENFLRLSNMNMN